MSYDAIGTIHHISDVETHGKFTKRGFILRIPHETNPDWDNYVPMFLTRKKVGLLDKFQVGQEVWVSYDLRGRISKKDSTKAYLDLDVWRIYDADKFRPSTSDQPLTE